LSLRITEFILAAGVVAIVPAGHSVFTLSHPFSFLLIAAKLQFGWSFYHVLLDAFRVANAFQQYPRVTVVNIFIADGLLAIVTGLAIQISLARSFMVSPDDRAIFQTVVVMSCMSVFALVASYVK
ncbi:unnamed protein product, partial [Urochloa humidicola]